MIGEPNVFIAFGAGLLSFLSPCVLPIIPSYLCFIGGVSLSSAPNSPAPKTSPRVIMGTLFFVLGFSTIFIAMSIIFSQMMLFMDGVSRLIDVIAGLIVIVMGVHVLWNCINFLNYDKRIHPQKRPEHPVACFLTGMAFGAGWTPCIGPILTSILFIAGQTEELLKAVAYLGAYSLGLGLPFMLCAIFLQHALKQMAKVKRLLPLIHKASGIILILLGVIIMFGRFQGINIAIQRYSNLFIAWAHGESAMPRLIPAALLLAISCLPLIVCLFLKKRMSTRLIIMSSIFLVLALLQLTGFLPITRLLADWLVYQQNYS
jgi:cytochrome c-type biogenesis protein